MIKKATKELKLSGDQVTVWEEINKKYESVLTDRTKGVPPCKKWLRN